MYFEPPHHCLPTYVQMTSMQTGRYSQAVYPSAWRPLMCEQAVSQNHHL